MALYNPCTTRRSLFGVGAGLVLAAPLQAEADSPAAKPALSDADLLAALAAFDDLERQIRDAYPKGCTFEGEKAWDEQIAPFRAEQSALLGLICTMRAHTVPGIMARARSLLAWDGGGWLSSPDDPDGYDDRRLIAALVRDVSALAGVA